MPPDPRMLRSLVQDFIRLYPEEAAQMVERLPPDEAAALLERQDPTLAAEVLRRLPGEAAAAALGEVSEAAAAPIVAAIEPVTAAALLSRLDEERRKQLVTRLDPALAREVADLLTYPPDVAGGFMDPRAASFRPRATAREALTKIRAAKGRRIQDVFVVDEEGRLTGAVGLHDLALAEPGTRLESLAAGRPISVQAMAPREDVVAIAESGRVASIPVVDLEDRLLGVIHPGDLVAATQEAASADIQTMVGVSPDERALSRASFAVRKRLPWLQINLVTAFLAAAVVGLFEDTIAQFTALAVLLPVVAGQSGNTGAQALAVTMRGLALREIRVRHWARVGGKELIVGAVNGVAVAAVTALGVYIWSDSAGLAGVMGVSMVCSMIVAGLAGASVPMALTLMGQDPAAASSIILTTVTDVMGFLTFLGFATLASGML
ncbi:MAG TPA: magnesium transporter [Gemmatimonadales bacterium]|nr:magnesium transporter [Gemmatimonadales bacterium]